MSDEVKNLILDLRETAATADNLSDMATLLRDAAVAIERRDAIIRAWMPIVAGARVAETPTHFRCGPPAPGGTATACMKLSPEFRPEAVEREMGKSGGTE